MKAKYPRINWLVLLLGMLLVAAGFATAATYLGLERKIHSTEAFGATLDRLYLAQQLSAGLKTLHDGDTATAAQRLDLLLCDNILMINSGLAQADAREGACVKDVLARIARLRPKNPIATAGAIPEVSNDQIEAERILVQACAGITR